MAIVATSIAAEIPIRALRTIRKLMGGGRAKYKKIRARENLIKKILARQLTLRNIHARAWKKFIQGIW